MKRGLSGLVVIVVGVLLALAADAAWAERNQRARELVLLQDLLEEFRENEARLLADIETNINAQRATQAWAAAMTGDAVIGSDSLATLFYAAHFGARFDPITGVLRSVIDGGELGIIRDDKLRAALAGWSDRAEEARLTDQEVTNMRANLVPLLLNIEPGAVRTSAETVAIGYEVTLSDGNWQLTPLLDDLRDLVGLLESQLNR